MIDGLSLCDGLIGATHGGRARDDGQGGDMENELYTYQMQASAPASCLITSSG